MCCLIWKFRSLLFVSDVQVKEVMQKKPSEKSDQIEQVMKGFFTDQVREWLDPWVKLPEAVTFSEVCTVNLFLPMHQLGDITSLTCLDQA